MRSPFLKGSNLSLIFLTLMLFTTPATSIPQECQVKEPICATLAPYLTEIPTFSIRERKHLTNTYDLVQLLAQYPQSQRTIHGFFAVDSNTEEHVLTLATFTTEIGTDFHLLSATSEAIIVQKSGPYGYKDDKIKYFFDLQTKTVSSPRPYPNVTIGHALVVENDVFLAGHTKNRGDVLLRLTPSENHHNAPAYELTQKLGGKPIGPIRELRLQNTTVIGISQSHSYHFKQGAWSYQLPLTKILKGVDGATNIRVLDQPSPTDQSRLQFPHTPEGPTTVLVWDQLLNKHLQPSPGYGMTRFLNGKSTFVPMPQPTYQDFKRIRSDRVADGYTKDIAQVGNALGAWHVEGNQIWFGTTFYDGEGETGIGGFGRYDVVTNQIYMTYLPDVASWSMSTIFMSDGILSMGLVSHPEGVKYSGGLVQYDINTKHTQHFDVPGIIHVIREVNNTLVLGTTNGISLINGKTIQTGTFDVDQEGQYELIWQTSALSRSKKE